ARIRQATLTYSRIGLETQVLGANPQQLIALLFDGALAAIQRARLHLRNGNISDRGLAISKAIDIIESGLKSSLDHKVGGDLAAKLVTVYDLAIQNLMLANLHADMQKLELAERLLRNIGEAWKVAAGISNTPASE